MAAEDGPTRKRRVEHYDAQYGHFAEALYAEIRRESCGEDIGQNGWLTAAEHDLFLSWLDLDAGDRVLDVACGSGGPSLRWARKSGCAIHGIDIHEQGLANAREGARRVGLEDRATFERVDGSTELPFGDAAFDAVVCIDAVNHLEDRRAVFAEWARVLEPGGTVLFTDPIVVTGPLTDEEIAIRSSIGFFLFVPPGCNDRLLDAAGLQVLRCEDRTENMATIAARWGAARQRRADRLREIEGEATFEGQQSFFAVASRIAREGRLSRFAYLARKPV